MADQELLVEKQGAVVILTLNRPQRLNALTRSLLAALKAALDEAERDEAVRAVVLTGTGRAFSAGQDLAEAGVMDAEDRPAALERSLEAYYHPAALAMRRHRCPIVVALNGIAAGAAANLALAGDLLLMAEEASFLQAFTRIGLIPDCGGTWLLPRLIGEQRARALMLLAEPLSAHDALAWGLAHRTVPAAFLLGEARALAERLAHGPSRAYALIKRALAETWSNGFAAQLSTEAALQREVAASADFTEGVTAFREGRSPGFHGR